MNTHYRQGDVLIIATDAAPKDTKPTARESGRVILAHGELTGHAHAIADKPASMRETAQGRRFLSVKDAPVHLRHEEHATIALPPGLYQVARQTEYSPEELRNVAD